MRARLSRPVPAVTAPQEVSGKMSDDSEQKELVETEGHPLIHKGAREAVMHPGIDGTWHHYRTLEWWDPENMYDDDHARPICPVDECASGEPHECRTICERKDVDTEIADDFVDVEGPVGGAWFCRLHGWFRVFAHPREQSSETAQQKLIPDGGSVEDENEQYAVHQCYDCGLGLTNQNPDRVTCDNCGSRDWVLVVA